MNYVKNEPMAAIASQVHTTKDYSIFKSIDGNRSVNQLHLRRLKNSIASNYLFTVIIVNEKYQIIDGQHRFEVIKELGYPLHYIICKNYGLKEVHIFNQNNKTWNADDYLEGYIRLGYENYILYKSFKLKYKLNHNETLALIYNTNSCPNIVQEFYSGRLQIKNMNDAIDKIEKILMIEPYYAGVRRRIFIYTMLGLFKNPNFSILEFIQKLQQQPTALHNCVNVRQYLILIEEIYNYKRRDKINLRF